MTELLPIATIILLLVVVVLLIAMLFRKTSVDLSPLQQELQATVRDEIAKNRAESSATAKHSREELRNNLKAFADTLNKNFTGLTQTSFSNAKAAREEAAANLQRLTETLVVYLGEIAKLQRSQLDVFSERLDRLTQTNEQKLDKMRENIERRFEILQEDSGKNLVEMRQESTASIQKSREDVAVALKASNESVSQTINDWVNWHRTQFGGIIEQLKGLTETNDKRFDSVPTAVKEKLKTIQDESALNHDKMREAIEQRFGVLQEDIGKKLVEMQQEATTGTQKSREEVTTALKAINESVGKTICDFVTSQQRQLSIVLDQLKTMTDSNEKWLDTVRATLEQKLKPTQEDNPANLEKSRQMIDETLNGTFEKQLFETQESGDGEAAKPEYDQRNECRIKGAIEQLGGTVEQESSGKPLIGVDLQHTDVTDAELEQLKGLTNLLSLNLSNTPVTDAGLEHLKDFTNLQSLILVNTQVSDTGFAHLRGLKNLVKLDLGRTQVTDTDWEYIEELAKLQWLSLWKTQVSDNGLKHLRGLTELRWLDLSSTKVTDSGLEYLEGLTNLRSLDLGHQTQVTNAGVEHLKGLTQLQTLDLVRTQVTDAGLEYLKRLTSLQILDVRGTNVTDAGLEHIKGLNALQRLNLGNTKVSDEGVGRLQQALPHCMIRNCNSQSRSQVPVQAAISPRSGTKVNEERPTGNEGAAKLDMAMNLVLRVLSELANDDGFVCLSDLKKKILKKNLEFSERTLGYSSFKCLLDDMQANGLVEVRYDDWRKTWTVCRARGSKRLPTAVQESDMRATHLVRQESDDSDERYAG